VARSLQSGHSQRVRVSQRVVCSLAVLVTATSVGCACSSGRPHAKSRPPAASTESTVPTSATSIRHGSLEGVSFDYPTWLRLDPMRVDEHYTQIIGYLSNQALRNPCHTTAGATYCGMPLHSLRADGVLVEISEHVPMLGFGNLVRQMPGTLRTIGGRAAKVWVISSSKPFSDPRCFDLGAARAIDGSIRVQGNARGDTTLDVLVCIGPRSVAEQQAALAVINSIRVAA
jgi:hypothetical protein